MPGAVGLLVVFARRARQQLPSLGRRQQQCGEVGGAVAGPTRGNGGMLATYNGETTTDGDLLQCEAPQL